MSDPDRHEKELSVTNSPFASIPKTSNQKIKVWDLMAWELDTTRVGRVRILAVVPKKPDPLENIKFSISWCAPNDLKHFTKKRSNLILVGRWESTHLDAKPSNSAGIVTKLDTLKDFPELAINALKTIPKWFDGFVPRDNQANLMQHGNAFDADVFIPMGE